MLLITTFYLLRVSRTRKSSPPPFHPGVSLPEILSAAIPSECLAPGNPLRRHSIRVSRTRNPLRRHSIRVSHSRNPFRGHSIRVFQNSSPAPFHPNVSRPESYPPTFHLLLMSHIRNSIQSTFHLLRMSHIRNSLRRCSTFFFILRAFSLGSKIAFLIKLCCRFYFWQAIFHTSSIF